jgi:outer membrane protein assembly factor BamB
MPFPVDNTPRMRYLRLAVALVALVAPLALGRPLDAGDWPRFRGPNGSGVAETAGLPAELSARANVVWKTALPPGYSSPVVVGDRIFLTAIEDERLLTLCLRRADGSELWRREAPRPRRDTLDRRNGPASPTPVADERRVVVFFHDFGVVAYDHAGRERWRAPLGPFDNVYGMGASPILAGGLVVLVCDQVTGSFVVAFDADSGAERWRTARPQALSGHSTPILLATPAGRTQVLAPGSFRLDAYDLQTGAVEWFANGLPSEMKSGAVLGPDAVFVVGYGSPLNEPGQQPRLPPFAAWLAERDSDHDGRVDKAEADETTRTYFVFVDLDRDGFVSEAEWKTNQAVLGAENGLLALRTGGRGELGPGSLLWKHTRAVPQLPTPVLYRGVLYMINDGGILTTLDPASGAMLEQGRLRGAPDEYYASPVAGDGKLYFVSRSGIVTVLRAGPGQQVVSVGDLEDEVAATPAIADGRVFVRTRGALYCFGTREAANAR